MPKRTVPAGDAGERLDAWLARTEPHHSRARWQQLIRDGRVLVAGAARKGSHPVGGGEEVSWEEPPPAPVALVPEARALAVLYEDADLLVLDKPPGLVVHPAPGHATGTLVHALLHHCGPTLAGIGGERRPGIVHRLDRDTSGVMVVAKTERAMRGLVEQFRRHTVGKTYLALAWGEPVPPTGRIETLVGRHPVQRQRMSTAPATGRRAVSTYERVEAYGEASLLRVRIETGRTHQIRVHLAHIGHPVVGDRVYGRARGRLPPGPAPRQMLHAAELAFVHPATGQEMEFVAPTPPDMRALIRAWRENRHVD